MGNVGGGGGYHDELGKIVITAIQFVLLAHISENPHITDDSPPHLS